MIEGTGGSLIAASPTLLDFDAVEDGPAPAAQRVQVTHQGSVSLDWTAQAMDGWVTLSRTSGSTPGSVDVSIAVASLGPGSHSSSLRISAPAADNGFVDVTVRVDVTEAPRPSMVASPNALRFEGYAAGVLGPQTVNLSSTGAALGWSAGAGTSAWVIADHDTGTTPDSLQVSVDAESLGEGTHHGSLILEAAGAANTPVTVAVTAELTEAPGPVLDASPPQLIFNADAGADPPAAQVVTLSNLGAGSFGWTATADHSWVTVTPSSGTCSSSQALSVGVDHAGMEEGTEFATVTLRSPGTEGAPATVSVSLTVHQGTGEFGEACAGPADCASGICVDGLCSRRCEMVDCPRGWSCRERDGKMVCVPGGGDSDVDIDLDSDIDLDTDADSDADSDSDTEAEASPKGCGCGAGQGGQTPAGGATWLLVLGLVLARRRR